MNLSAIMTRAALGTCAGLALWMPLSANATTSYGAPVAFERPGFTNIRLWDISDSGVIVGASDGVGFTYSAGTFTSFSYPDATTETSLTGVANNGTLVGTYSSGDVTVDFHGFIYSGGSYKAFDIAGAVSTSIRHISSDARYLTGYTTDATGAGSAFAFDLSSNTYTNLGVAGDGLSIAQGANTLGQVTGSFSRSGGIRGSFIVDLNTMVRTEYLEAAGMTGPRFRDINDAGVVTGFSTSGAGFVGKPGDWTVFSAPVDSSTYGYGLNNSGILVGYTADNVTGAQTGWVAAPIPEPGTWALMALGLASLALRKRSQG
ncbi:PEP-CTERM sorting domain-containing protein [Paucibacter sp. B2R-40]|uniref:PEP-CTERM sorting domain-containing protein n=1 Tax=Paucibacter sp. B2R-40 TaxID=2893554 RepID=UPI0021E377B4|nr:PEP-CTERM sorting domain-containing protein [Paucibacter sp. B2R-40]MCV2352665.1 PEP-CTERM sorting domain-containing protein [Paucibacter sp. B2R-40]